MERRRRRVLTVLLVGALAGGCSRSCGGDDDGVVIDAGVDAASTVTFTIGQNRRVDLLFVIDNSGSMATKQDALVAALPSFLDRLAVIGRRLPDLHLGVVSTNVGTGGVNIGGCSSVTRPMGDDGNLLVNNCVGITGQFLSDVEAAGGGRTRNYTGDLATLAKCIVQLGTTGCGFEQPLEAMDRALAANKNPGFVRADAHLAVVLFGDEDDCSAVDGGALFGDPNGTITSPLGPRTSFRCHEFGVACADDPNPRATGLRHGCVPRVGSQYMNDVQPYIDRLRAREGADRHVVVAALAGPVDAQLSVNVIPDPDDTTRPSVGPSCTGANGTATPAIRTGTLVDAFAGRGLRASICNDALADAMADLASLIAVAIGRPCIDRALADRDPGTPGVQPECSVADVTNPDEEPPTRVVSPIAACDDNGGAPPCWRFVADPQQCPNAPDNRAIEVDRAGASVPLGTVLEVQCVTE